MNNSSIVNTISDRLELSVDESSRLLDCFISVIKEKCGNCTTVAIPGFGQFVPHKENEKVIFCEENGKHMLVPPKVCLSFEESTILKSRIASKDL